MPPKFFITHSWKDIEFARKLTDDLRKHGLDGFFDAYSMKPGDSIASRIEQGLNECEVYMPILSSSSLKSQWCRDEIDATIFLTNEPGRNGRPRIVPVLVEDCSTEMPLFLRKRLYIDFANRYKEAVQELLSEVFDLNLEITHQNSSEGKNITGQNIQVTVIVEGDKHSFTNTKQEQFVFTLSKLLDIQTDRIRVLRVDSGSIVVTLEMPHAVARKLKALYDSQDPNLRILGILKVGFAGQEMILIPAGEFVMGEGNQVHKVFLDAFYISRFPITNAEYKKFVDATKHNPPSHWSGGKIPAGKENHPVVNVTWHDAVAYCEWSGASLPTEAEWEKAASWDDVKKEKHIYPWSNNFDASKCNTSDSKVGGTTPVGKYSPQGDSPYGVADMAGNVWEWCADWYDESQNDRSMSGGSWVDDRSFTRCTFRSRGNVNLRLDTLGFRVAQSVPS